MRSITTFDLQYAHRFYGFQGEAQYLHGHTGVLTIEVEDTVNEGVNMVYPCNEIQKVAWDVLKNFDHALVLREDDPLLPAILDVYEKQGIKNGHPQNKMKGEAFKTPLATAYPDCRLVVVLSEDIGVHKPFPEIFYFAMSATQSELHTSLMIGDNWKNDVEGAKNVGMGK